MAFNFNGGGSGNRFKAKAAILAGENLARMQRGEDDYTRDTHGRNETAHAQQMQQHGGSSSETPAKKPVLM